MSPHDLTILLEERIAMLRTAISRGNGREAARLVGRIHVLGQELYVSWPHDFENTVKHELSKLSARPQHTEPYVLEPLV